MCCGIYTMSVRHSLRLANFSNSKMHVSYICVLCNNRDVQFHLWNLGAQSAVANALTSLARGRCAPGQLVSSAFVPLSLNIFRQPVMMNTTASHFAAIRSYDRLLAYLN